MENKDFQKLEEIIKEKYLQCSFLIQDFYEKFKDPKGYSLEYAKCYADIITNVSELEGLLKAAQIFNIKYIPNEISISETLEKYWGFFFEVLELEDKEKKAYKKLLDDYLKRDGSIIKE